MTAQGCEVQGYSFRKFCWVPLVLVFLLVAGLEVWGNIVSQASLAPVSQSTLKMTGEFSGGTYEFNCTPDPKSPANQPRSFWTFTANFFNVTGTKITSNGGNAPHNGGCPPAPSSETELTEFILSLLRGDASLAAKYEGALHDIAVEVARIIIGI